MGKIAILSNARLKQFQSAPGKSIAVDIEHHGTDTAEFYQLPGFHGKPQDGAECVVLDCNGNNIVIATHDYSFGTEIEKGEALIYSYDSAGALKAKILLKVDGEIVINDGTDYAVKFNELQTAFNKLKSDFDLHTHGGVTTGSGSTSMTTASTADIAPAKVTKVRI
jgi:phage gp45-like